MLPDCYLKERREERTERRREGCYGDFPLFLLSPNSQLLTTLHHHFSLWSLVETVFKFISDWLICYLCAPVDKTEEGTLKAPSPFL